MTLITQKSTETSQIGRTLAEQNKNSIILKIIKIIKDIFTDDSWSKYLKYENIDVLRNEIISELINTRNM